MPKTKIKQLRKEATADYAAFLRSLDLKWIALTQSNFEIDRDRYFDSKEHKLSVNWKSEIEHIGSDYFEGRAGLEVALQPTGKRTEIPFSLKASFVVHI